jgi:hypothetical protein
MSIHDAAKVAAKVIVPRGAAIPPRAGGIGRIHRAREELVAESGEKSTTTLYLTQPRSFPKAPRCRSGFPA